MSYDIERDLISLVKRSPFYNRMVMLLGRISDTKMPYAAGVSVRGGLKLRYNPDTMRQFRRVVRLAILEHEVLHVVNRHFARLDDIEQRKGFLAGWKPEGLEGELTAESLREVWNLAADMAINQLIESMPREEFVFPEHFGLKRMLSAEEYFKLLVEYAIRNDCVSQISGEGSCSGGDPKGTSSSPSPCSSSNDTSGNGGTGESGRVSAHSAGPDETDAGGGGKTGKPQPSNSKDSGNNGQDADSEKANASAGGNGDAGENGEEGEDSSGYEPEDGQNEDGESVRPRGKLVGDHSEWDAEADEVRRAEALVEATIRECHARGIIPGNLEALVRDVLSPRVDWRQQLRAFPASVRSDTRRRTWARPSRRLPGVIRGRKREESFSLVIATDTSGSMAALLPAVEAELRAIAKEATEVKVIQCDSVIQRVYDFNGTIEPFRGLGGTAFTPVFEYIQDRRNGIRADAVIYLTDGYGDNPSLYHIPVLWVVFPVMGRHHRPAPWGRVLLMPQA